MEMTPLSDVLGKDTSAGRDEKGRFASSEPPAAADSAPASPVDNEQEQPAVLKQDDSDQSGVKAAPPADEPENGHVPVAALKDERRKRQDLEEKVKAFEAKLKEVENRPVQQQPMTPPPNLLEDPTGWQQYQMVQQQRTALEMSQFMMRTSKTDYQEFEDVFVQEAEKNPVLVQAMQNHPLHLGGPAAFAYEQGKRIAQMRKLSEIGDVDSYVSKKAEEIAAARIADARKEWESEQAKILERRGSLPRSLVDDRSSAVRDHYTGPTPLAEVLSKQRKG